MRVTEVTGSEIDPTVVFVHGAGMAGWMWDAVKPAFSGFRIVTVDMSDHGTSRDEPFRSVDSEADRLAETVRALTDDPVILIGHSLGAKVVLACVVRHAELARGVVVSSALVRPSALARWMASPSLCSFSLKLLRRKGMAEAQARAFGFPTEEMRNAYVADVAALDVPALLRPLEAFAETLCLPEGLGRLTCPALVTVGSREPRAMRESARDLARSIPKASLSEISGADHAYPWKRSGEYSKAIVDWIRGL